MKIFPDPNEQNDGGAVRPPPPPPITIRTMDSDVKSVEQTGGGRPVGETLNLGSEGVKRPEPPKLTEEGVKIKIPGYSGPEEKLFSPETLPEQKPEMIAEKKSFKALPVVIIIVVAALIGAAGYYFVYPLLLQTEVPVGDVGMSANPPPPPPPPAATHAPLILSDKAEESTSMSAASQETIAGAPILKEVILKNQEGAAVLLSEYLPSLVPEFSVSELIATFEEDFTAFVYYDENGSWPGYVLKRKEGVSPLIAQNYLGKLESSQNLKSLFIEDPGEVSGEFKSGEYKGVATRYLVYANKNAAVDYAWANGDLLVLTTYFPALKEVLDNRINK
ncbi:MAG: hypothetical protein HYT12_01530 [Candidatus Liptonbacteria bacterium]|nr:hypothetical protein [Candidatus Liptonbacteria bacterium]